MATLLGTTFSSDEKVVLQTDTQTLGSFAETLVIKFDQAKFEEYISKNKISPTVRSCRRIRRSTNPKFYMTPTYVNTTLAEDSLGLAKGRTDFAKIEGNLILASSEDQDVNTSDLGHQSLTPLGVRFKASRDAYYSSSLEAKNGGNPSSKSP